MLTIQSSRPASVTSPRQHAKTLPGKPFKPSKYFTIGFLLGLGALVALPAYWVSRGGHAGHDLAWAVRLVVFVGSLFALMAMLAAVGVAVTGQRVGVLWTSRNTYSLSRLQVTMWTLLVLAALAAVAALRAQGLFVDQAPAGLAGALAIAIPNELLAVMGISILSAAAAPAILSVKSRSDTATSRQIEAAEVRVGGKVEAMGSVAVRPDDCPPLVRDLFQGDEVSKAGTVDIGKLQQAIVTVILWGTYLAMVAGLFVAGTSQEGVTPLPPLSETFVFLLGISHVGYLAYKASPSSTGGATPASPSASPASPSQALPRPLPPAIR